MVEKRTLIAQELDACDGLLGRVEGLAWTEREMLLDELTAPKAKRMLARILVNDNSEIVRGAALDVLGEHGSRKDYRTVIAGFADVDWYVRASAYSAAAERGFTKAAGLLLQSMATDPHPIGRRYAIVAFADLQGEAAVPELLGRIAVEKDDRARVGIFSALVQLGKMEHLPALQELSLVRNPHISCPAKETLKEIGLAFEEEDEPDPAGADERLEP